MALELLVHDQNNYIATLQWKKKTGFTLDSAPSSGPRNLNFTGELANQGVTTATFSLSPFDPGAGNTATFTLTQVPTIPEPETYAMLLAGLALMGYMAKRTSRKENA